MVFTARQSTDSDRTGARVTAPRKALRQPSWTVRAAAPICSVSSYESSATNRTMSGINSPGRFTQPEDIGALAVFLCGEGAATVTGAALEISPRSICVHGDTPGAVALATAVRTALERAGVALTPFA